MHSIFSTGRGTELLRLSHFIFHTKNPLSHRDSKSARGAFRIPWRPVSDTSQSSTARVLQTKEHMCSNIAFGVLFLASWPTSRGVRVHSTTTCAAKKTESLNKSHQRKTKKRQAAFVSMVDGCLHPRTRTTLFHLGHLKVYHLVQSGHPSAHRAHLCSIIMHHARCKSAKARSYSFAKVAQSKPV